MQVNAKELAPSQDSCCSNAPSPAYMIPSIVKSLQQELEATRMTVVALGDRLATVLSAPKKDACLKGLAGCVGDGPSLANDLSALGNGFYNERQAIEDLLARLQL